MLMDEPFSAVDPVVRDQLQDEFLRLQDELGKTIVFVTHDIDEAIKLGDQVAVLRVGGKLAQLAPPAELLSRPVDAFVAGFVGRDRGYRALGFTSAGTIPTHEEPTITMGEALPAKGEHDWLLAVNEAGAPQGWLNLKDEPHGAVVEDGMLYRGGTLATQGGTLRSALDACLSSPSGRGIVVDDSGRLVGSTTAREVLDLIEALPGAAVVSPRRPSRSRSTPQAPRRWPSSATSSTTRTRSSATCGTTPGSRSSLSWWACCSRSRWVGSRGATAGSTRR
jgi:osmoprotectant transport system ATP-binding protein